MKAIFIILYQRPVDGRWEWHAIKGKTYLAVSPCSFATKAAAKRSAVRCVKEFKQRSATFVWGK